MCRTYHYHKSNGTQHSTTGTQHYIEIQHDHASDFRAIAGNLAAEAPAIVLPRGHVFDVKSMHSILLLKNETNQPLLIDVYECITKADTNVAGGAPTEFLSTPGNAWQQGLVNQGMAASYFGNVWCSPYESDDFLRLFKIVKKKHFIIPTNGFKIMKHKKKNYTVPYEKCIDTESSCIKGVTTGTIVVQKGLPSKLSAAGNNTATYSLAGLSWMHYMKYVVRNTGDVVSDIKISRTIGTLSTAATSFIDYTTATNATAEIP